MKKFYNIFMCRILLYYYNILYYYTESYVILHWALWHHLQVHLTFSPAADEELCHLQIATAARHHQRRFVEAILNVNRDTVAERQAKRLQIGCFHTATDADKHLTSQ